MMKKLLFFLVLFGIKNISNAQEVNLSGTWVGTVNNAPNTLSPITLKLELIDSCNVIRYRVQHYEDCYERKCNNGHCYSIKKQVHIAYDFIQSRNLLIRNAVSFWKDYTDPSDVTGPGRDIQLVFINGKLTGTRSIDAMPDPEHQEAIVLTLQRNVTPIILECPYLKPTTDTSFRTITLFSGIQSQ